MPAKQSKHWCFTLNNFTSDEYDKLVATGTELQDIDYLVFGKEKGDTEETPHLQGYIVFSTKKTFNYAKGSISSRAHLEAKKGTPKQAADYCKKDGDFKEFGNLPKTQGRRTDLEHCAELIRSGASIREIADAQPSAIIRYGNGIARLRQHYRPERKAPPEIWVLHGRTGTGKTRRVWEFADVEQLWVHPGEKWFDGYDGHRAVLFDDFDGGWFKLTYLLKLIDRYIFQVPIKGGHTWWAPKVIYFTSNLHPRDWYTQAHQEHKNALLRRLREFGTIQECTNY